ncbi:hypothetical protein T02_1635 [Trichinella nativa]|uniref:Uncharacterized protein n=1 Tax=Trichinella nativa TaxID=6335 RepID=A0A0V1KN85_9BILA|nr:hypothetical protein T02_1635 [Trichinella nativa]
MPVAALSAHSCSSSSVKNCNRLFNVIRFRGETKEPALGIVDHYHNLFADRRFDSDLAGGARVLFLPTRDFRVPPLDRVTPTGSVLFRTEHHSSKIWPRSNQDQPAALLLYITKMREKNESTVRPPVLEDQERVRWNVIIISSGGAIIWRLRYTVVVVVVISQ